MVGKAPEGAEAGSSELGTTSSAAAPPPPSAKGLANKLKLNLRNKRAEVTRFSGKVTEFLLHPDDSHKELRRAVHFEHSVSKLQRN